MAHFLSYIRPIEVDRIIGYQHAVLVVNVVVVLVIELVF
jgi:hypothetical protein